MIGVILSVIFLACSAIICLYNLYIPHYNNVKHYIFGFILFSLVLICNSFLPFPILKPFTSVLALILILKIMLKVNLKLSILYAIFVELLCIISENLYVIVLLFLNGGSNPIEWYSSYIGMAISNFIIAVIMLIINSIIINKKINVKFIHLFDFLKSYKFLPIIITFFIIIVVLFFLVYFVYYKNRLIVYLTMVLTFVIYTFIIISTINTINKYEKIKGKYLLSIENLKEYEIMLNQYRLATHENKNQLLLIRNMISDKKTINYIDKIIDNKNKDDSNNYNIINTIPCRVIRAVIYSKVLLMNNKKLKYEINVSRALSSKNFSNISDDMLLNVCNILNVFIDNAIEEVNNHSKKQILIEFNLINDEIEITVSNTCRDNIDINQIYNMGYTNKGENHGYGLSIVKKIINDNSEILRNNTIIENNIFTQQLYIKLIKK